MEGTRSANGALRCYGESLRANGRPDCCERCELANKQPHCGCLGNGARVGLAWPGPLAVAAVAAAVERIGQRKGVRNSALEACCSEQVGSQELNLSSRRVVL
uniref:Uncharacterized protein n=1 Tax=Sphaerodactylus townsendi TaxID=933632 RepID=A0ACB8G9F3_9SAUR